jgi:hypothetical protein
MLEEELYDLCSSPNTRIWLINSIRMREAENVLSGTKNAYRILVEKAGRRSESYKKQISK